LPSFWWWLAVEHPGAPDSFLVFGNLVNNLDICYLNYCINTGNMLHCAHWFSEKGWNIMQKITPCLWFDNNAEQAVQFYTSKFKDSKILNVSYYTEEGPMPAGTVLTISFLLHGQEFLALNGGPVFKFSQAISFVVNCDTQEEIDHLVGSSFSRR
jgi:hypothetical protein